MIYIQTLDKNWTPGLQLLKNQNNTVKKAFEMYIAYEFVKEVKNAIDTQKYKSKWKPLSPQYLAYKKRNGLSLIMWEATKELKTNLKVMNRKDTIVIGWDKRLYHKKQGNRLPLYKIAKILEYGTLKVPPRPLFRLVFTSISKNIRKYWDKFSTEYLDSNNIIIKNVFKKNKQRLFKDYIYHIKISLINLVKRFKRGGS